MSFKYAAVDAAGQPDPTPATVTMPFTNIALSGTVFDDANGNQIQNIGPEPGTNAGGPLYVNLLDSTGDHRHRDNNRKPERLVQLRRTCRRTPTYVLQLTMNQGVVGQPAPAVALPPPQLGHHGRERQRRAGRHARTAC